MSKFTFIMPDGQLFTLTGPAGSTQAQAEKIYLEQLQSGALVGLRPGDTLENKIAKIEKFELSRFDRGTAGVEDIPLLSINNEEIISSLPVLANVQISNGITTSDFVSTSKGIPVGPLTATQVQSITAQIAKSVDQSHDVITQEKGIGKYGFNSPQLENSGHVKPGTSCRFLGIKSTTNNPATSQPNPDNFVSVMSSPSVWTGKNGVTSIDKLLSDTTLQDNIQQGLITSSYTSLVETGQITTTSTTSTVPVGQVYSGSALTTGLIVGGASALALFNSGTLSKFGVSGIGNSISSIFSSKGNPLSGVSLSSITNGIGGLTSSALGSVSKLASNGVAQLGGLLSNASKFGVGTATAWAKGITPDALTSQLNGLAKQSQFAINFSDFKLPTAIAGIVPAAAFTNTVNRQTVDAATAKIIGSGKIPTPSFGGTSIDSTFGGALSGQAGALLKNVTGSFGGITAGLPNVSGLPNIPGLPNVGGLSSRLPSISGMPNLGSLATPGFAGALSGGGVNKVGTSTTDSAVADKTSTVEERQMAIKNLEIKQGIYEVAKAEYGISSPQAQEAFAQYKVALAYLDTLG